MLTVINVLFIFFLLVIVHELGHFFAARWANVRADRFQVGFGKSFIRLGQWGDTEFSVGPWPIGGFVAIHGMAPGDYAPEERAFQDAPLFKRAIVILAGPFMSLLLGYILFIVVGTTYGIMTLTEPPTFGTVQKDKVAWNAGIRDGDRVLAIEGEPVTKWDQLAERIHMSVDRPIQLTLERKGEQFSTIVVPEKDTVPDISDPLRPKKIQIGRIFCMPDMERKRVGVAGSVSTATAEFGGNIMLLVGTLTSKFAFESIGGPVAIVSVTSQASQRGFAEVLSLAGQLSLSLGVINLLPIPVLDGGHLFLYFVEFLRGGRRFSAAAQMRIQAAGLVILAAIFLLVMTLDITRLVSGTMP